MFGLSVKVQVSQTMNDVFQYAGLAGLIGVIVTLVTQYLGMKKKIRDAELERTGFKIKETKDAIHNKIYSMSDADLERSARELADKVRRRDN